METGSKRRRLKPDERINEILNAAAQLVVSDGIAQLNMERIASRAGVSKGLLYAYFPNVKTLLQAVLLREHQQAADAQLTAIAANTDFETMARATAHNNHQRFSDRGLLIERLRGDPEIASVMTAIDAKARAAVIDYLTKQVTTHFNIPVGIARTATSLAIGPGQHPMSFTPLQIKQMDEVWGAMMTGAMQELEKRFGKKVEDKVRQ